MKLLKSLEDHFEIIIIHSKLSKSFKRFLDTGILIYSYFYNIHLQKWNFVYVSYNKFLNYRIILKKKTFINVDQHIFI